MYDLFLVDFYYKKIISDLSVCIPEGLYSVDLALLHRFDLLHFQSREGGSREPLLTHCFHFIDSLDKLLLINDEFVVWIVPSEEGGRPMTYTLIALNLAPHMPRLEVAYITSGVYNAPKLSIKVLEKFLNDIQETERALSQFQNLSS